MRIESAVHGLIAEEFISERADAGWVLVSSPNPIGVRLTEDMERVSRGIYECFLSSFSFFEQLTQVSPWNFVLLDYRVSESRDAVQDVGSLLEEIEVSLFQWLLQVLKAEYKEKWWTKGIPQPTRVQCATRREQEGEGETLPPEAYLTLIDFKDIVRNNWSICSRVVEEIAEVQGKDKATRWITELNEARKLWAHPIKQLFRQHDSAQMSSIRKLHSKVRRVVENDMKMLEKGKQ
ncbi:Swt1 family HEPN domain-containing protein [Candidatus Thiosymbion oneisti]|uniref:Swt1 family HEPN domain-containing protein n=1 Tax=Candidatus Thiosymbion oneisti TaxID=589554 RepID=UPI00105FD470|nr:Swt1 family HEPN domain-containing protein [Candidatus Thiosymbion oneisti]